MAFSFFIFIPMILRSQTSMIKAARKAASNAELARAFADIFTNRLRFVIAPHIRTPPCGERTEVVAEMNLHS